MSVAIPSIPVDSDLTAMEVEGYTDFGLGARLSQSSDREWVNGWRYAWARCYGQGVKASALIDPDHIEDPNPYPQFSGAWEAWGQGFNEEHEL